MSVTARAKIVIGFKILHCDFWEERVITDRFVSCPQGHPQGSKGSAAGKFCQECGGRCDYQESSEMLVSKGFAKYLGHSDAVEADKFFSRIVYKSVDDQMGSGSFGPDFEIHDVEGERVLGIAAVFINDILGGDWRPENLCMTQDVTVRIFGRVKDLAVKLGMERDPLLFLAAECG